MDAMIFAAGLGTRLRPLTDDRPKALVEVGGTAILEHVARRLVHAGADRIIINTHWHGAQVARYVEQHDRFGVDVRISHEPDEPLDTGGGLHQAAPHFRRERAFLLHNCDVVTDLDLRALHAAHAAEAIATLAVMPPSADRYLIFDDRGLCGFSPRGGGAERFAREVQGELRRRDFMGVHAASPRLLDTLHDGSYSIMTHYLELAAEGERIDAFEQEGVRWIDIGTHEKLAEAQAWLA